MELEVAYEVGYADMQNLHGAQQRETTTPMRNGIGAALLFCLCCGQLKADDITFMVRLVDAKGKPVEGADLGLMASAGDGEKEFADGEKTEWLYNKHLRSDAKGIAHVTASDDHLNRLCLIARHEIRKIASVHCVDRKSIDEGSPIEMTLNPETQVEGHVTRKQLAYDLGRIVVYVRFGGRTMLDCTFDKPMYRLSLPPGDYEIEAYAATADSARKQITVNAQSTVQGIDPFDLPATKLALLEGHLAPELAGVEGWKNTKPLSLESLRGKCILLEFWGHWCGPCVGQMPEVFKLHDKYADQGLVVIGIHISVATDPREHVDTVAKLDNCLTDTRKTLWATRDIPFPVALVKSDYEHAPDGIKATHINATIATYGVRTLPTQILIDRKGMVRRRIWIDDAEDAAFLENVLAEK